MYLMKEIMKEILLLLKDLLGLWKIKFKSIWHQFWIVCIDKSGDTVNKYNNAHHRTI